MSELRRKGKRFVISSSSHVAEALAVLEAFDVEIEKFLADPALVLLQKERAQLKEDIDAYILKRSTPYEDDNYKLTRVQGFRRTWNVSKLEAILPRGIFKNVIKMEADPQKIDQYVRDGKIDRKKIEPAFEESPNRAYVKMTKKSHHEERGEAEADALAEAMG